MNDIRDSILKAVLNSARELGEDLDVESLLSPTEDTALFGAKSGVDSITLVGLIAEVEDRLSTELGIDLVLADERAMSQRTSPFRRVSTLVDYICELHTETQKT